MKKLDPEQAPLLIFGKKASKSLFVNHDDMADGEDGGDEGAGGDGVIGGNAGVASVGAGVAGAIVGV